MNNLWPLTRLELRSFWGLNKYRWTRDPKAKGRYCLLGAVWVFLIALVWFYVGGLVYGLCLLDLSEAVIGYLAVIASFLILAVGIFQTGSFLFSSRGYDILVSLPVKPGAIALSRFLALYGESLVLALAIFLPGTVVYGLLLGPGFGFYFSVILGVFLIPAIPLVAAALLGTLVMALSAGMKHKSLIQTALMLAFVVGVLALSFHGEKMEGELTPEQMLELAGNINGLIGRLYPPALWLGQGTGGNWGALLLFLGSSAALMALMALVVSRNYPGIMERLQGHSTRQDYKISTLSRKGLLKALYLREVRRYFSSSVYVTNTIVGPIMGCMMAGALCFGGLEAVQRQLPIDLRGILPFVFGGVFTMMTTTATSISMEGRQFWIPRTLPIPAKTLLDSKILLNLSLMLPFYLLGELFLIVGLKPGWWELLRLVLIPGLLMVFAVVTGITVDLKLHSFHWEKETEVVKQSASSMLGGFAGMLMALVLGGLACFAGDLVTAAACIVLALLTAVLYRRNNKVDLAEL